MLVKVQEQAEQAKHSKARRAIDDLLHDNAFLCIPFLIVFIFWSRYLYFKA